jgi:tetratricopeptide (TPR) repeat protein
MLDLPPDVVPLQELRPLLKRFYNEAAVAALWKKAQPAYDEVIARYHEAATRAVLEVSTYLRHPTGGYLGRRFQIYVDLLGAPNQIHLRSFADDFFLVLTPSLEPHYGDVRRAYLQYLLDPAVVKYGMELQKKKSLVDYALGAPALDGMYKEDFPLLATKCLVKAVEARLERGRGPELVGQALREGYILTPHFYEQLSVYEKQEQAMKLYVAEMISSIDLNKEVQRLDKVEFAQSAQVRKARTLERPKPVLSGAAKTIEDAENLYAERKLDPARETFTRVLKETEDRPLHARAYYGLGRIAILQRDPGLGEKLLQKALELSPDPYVKGWVLVYLGRLADAAGERERAEKSYQEALQVNGASLAAHQAAEKGIRETFKK